MRCLICHDKNNCTSCGDTCKINSIKTSKLKNVLQKRAYMLYIMKRIL